MQPGISRGYEAIFGSGCHNRDLGQRASTASDVCVFLSLDEV